RPARPGRCLAWAGAARPEADARGAMRAKMRGGESAPRHGRVHLGQVAATGSGERSSRRSYVRAVTARARPEARPRSDLVRLATARDPEVAQALEQRAERHAELLRQVLARQPGMEAQDLAQVRGLERRQRIDQ